MATYVPSTGIFKGADAEPEATLEMFTDYLTKMDNVFRLSRPFNPVTGAKIEWEDKDKKAMLEVEGGEEKQDLFQYVGKVLEEDTYVQAVEKIKAALKGRENRTCAVFKLFHGHPQGISLFDSWHKEVLKAAQLIDWTDYESNKAAVDAIIMQTSSVKLQQRAIQDNPTSDQLVNLGITQEQGKKKASKLPGDSEKVSRLEEEVRQLKSDKFGKTKFRKESNKHFIKKDYDGGGDNCKKCNSGGCAGGSSCPAEGKMCNKCKKKGHFGASKMCQGKKRETSKKIQEATESVSDSEESLGRIIQKVAKMDVKKDETIYTKLKIAPMEDNKVEHSFCPATDTGVRKTILCRSDWMKINKQSKLYKTDIKFRPYGTGVQLPTRGRAEVWLRAQAGAVIKTYVYVNDDDGETSLLGKNDAERLGIVKINLRGSREEIKKPEKKQEEAKRIKMCRCSELKEVKEKTRTSENDEQKDKTNMD